MAAKRDPGRACGALAALMIIARELAELFSANDDITLFVWDHLPGWPVLHCTDNVRELIGYSKEDFYSRRVAFIDIVHPDDVERVSDEVRAGLEDQTSSSFSHEDYRLLRADGREVWVADTTMVERDEQGTVRYMIGYLLDITTRKNLELALLAERSQLQMVLEGTRLGSWDWAPQHNTLQVNQRWLTMYGLDENPPQVSVALWESLIHPEDRLGWHRALQMHLSANTPFYEHVYRIRHTRGHYLHVLDRGKVVEWNGAEPVRVAGTHTDISKQRQAELDAREAARSRTLFLANMSHEIRTPLHGILGLASVLASTELDDYQRQLLETIQESGDYLLNTLNDAIDISRADQGKLEIKPSVQSCDSLLTHLQSLFGEQARRRSIDYQVERRDGVPDWVLLDKSRFLQIAVNLVNNAFKFTKIGFIRVTLSWHNDVLTLQVADSGMGIEDTEKVWNVFEQESEESMHPKPGGGLGLGIVRSLVQLMGGLAEVQSEPGFGSTFTITLPVAATEPAMAASKGITRLPVYRILVIDDNDVNQLILGEMLSSLEQVYVATSSAEMGLQVLQSQEFDVVFMDIHMPDLDGVEATIRIRQQALKQPYIVGLTANAMPTMRQRAMAAGMNAYLTKPFRLTEIRQALTHVHELTYRKS
ncbi:hybrid sensor histidine kinase/response regulator [Aliidiomarina sedimenti]|uniref:histidine kinase n=1 Tax=Aliidiomarina sedimenti TaxID=1933879 RepID=A0ABY0C246_9GAMM|nr:PAS domain-containing protein [Aliidiomarina sedimenti]RUO31820.1 hybrid sensor histidine kinase/response regulator [Aliidiomarina sedimenti]